MSLFRPRHTTVRRAIYAAFLACALLHIASMFLLLHYRTHGTATQSDIWLSDGCVDVRRNSSSPDSGSSLASGFFGRVLIAPPRFWLPDFQFESWRNYRVLIPWWTVTLPLGVLSGLLVFKAHTLLRLLASAIAICAIAGPVMLAAELAFLLACTSPPVPSPSFYHDPATSWAWSMHEAGGWTTIQVRTNYIHSGIGRDRYGSHSVGPEYPSGPTPPWSKPLILQYGPTNDMIVYFVGWPMSCVGIGRSFNPATNTWQLDYGKPHPLLIAAALNAIMLGLPIGVLLPTAWWIRFQLRRRAAKCGSCGYPLLNLPPNSPCPECGHTQSSAPATPD